MTTPHVPPWRARLELFGWQAFYRRPVREAVLAALDTLGPLGPDHAGTGDAAPRPIDRQRLVRDPLGPGPAVLEVARLQQPGWEALMNLGDRAWMRILVPAATLKSTGARLWFDLGDALVDALQPDIAFVHLEPDWPSERAESDPVKRRLDAGVPAGDDYYEHGPGGLALRTCFGPRWIRQLGESRLAALAPPAMLRRSPNGCVCIDLVADPWDADVQSVLRSYERAMDVLRPSGVFAEPVPSSDGRLAWRAPEGVDLGGVARDSREGMRLDSDARADGGDVVPETTILTEAVRDGRNVLDVTLSWADLRGTDLTGLVADGLDLSWAQLDNASLRRARITGGSFDSANLGQTVLEQASIEDSGFDRSIAGGSSWRGAVIDRCTFGDAVLTATDFTQARISSSSFGAAMLGQARFERAELRDCNFTHAECNGVSFAGAALQRVDFANADLRGASFAGATLNDVSFEGALRDAEQQ
jgi:uncharacterized protein YjbI with pentapeptide repeats